jgi:hypothetical protein
LCNQKRFDLYLYSTLDTDDISVESIKTILESEDVSIISKFIDSLKEEQGRMFLIVLTSYAETLKKKSDFAFLIDYLFCNLSKIKFSSQFMLVDKGYFLGEICTISLKTIKAKDTLEIIDNSIAKSSDITTIIDFGARLERVKNHSGQVDFSSIDDQTRKDLISKIADEAFKENMDSFSYRVSFGISFLIRNKKAEMKDYICQHDLSWKASFLSKSIFVGRVDSSNRGSYNSYSYSIDEIGSVIDLSELKKEEILKVSLSDKERQNIIVLLMQIGNFKPDDGNNYYTSEDIGRYCEENGFQFVPSDSYEKPDRE